MTVDDGSATALSVPDRAAEPDLIESLFNAPSAADRPAAGDDVSDPAEPPPAGSRAARSRTPSRTRRGRVIPVIALVVIIAVSVAGIVVGRTALRSFKTPDYVGQGIGRVIVKIKTGDVSRDIARTLHDDGVVASTKAFVNAADRSGRSQDFQSGWFSMRSHMSGAAAVTLLLDPRARLSKKVTVPEGLIEPAVLALVAKSTGLSATALARASKNLAAIGVPASFGATSAEGFLFPSTYQYDPDVSATDALQDMTTQFQAEARTLKLPAAAAALRLRPYQLLTIASMVEAEARFATDRPKVARVVLNRLARHMPLGFDSTTAYGLKLQGKDPRTATYRENSRYNTRLHTGLPPTPIGNPGENALRAAEKPTVGNWLYFVSDDAAGHLLFTPDKKVFDAATAKCRVRHWGCI